MKIKHILLAVVLYWKGKARRIIKTNNLIGLR